MVCRTIYCDQYENMAGWGDDLIRNRPWFLRRTAYFFFLAVFFFATFFFDAFFLVAMCGLQVVVMFSDKNLIREIFEFSKYLPPR